MEEHNDHAQVDLLSDAAVSKKTVIKSSLEVECAPKLMSSFLKNINMKKQNHCERRHPDNTEVNEKMLELLRPRKLGSKLGRLFIHDTTGIVIPSSNSIKSICNYGIAGMQPWVQRFIETDGKVPIAFPKAIEIHRPAVNVVQEKSSRNKRAKTT